MNESQGRFTKRGVDYPIIDGMRTLPGRYYHSRDIYAEEVEKIFYKFWLFGLRAEQIPEIGDYQLVQIEDESIIVLRQKEDVFKAFFNVCRHRGTKLCTEPKGRFDQNLIQCPYHAWTYRLDGRLQSAPLMKEGHGFEKAKCSLHEAHVYNWDGFLFLNLDRNPEPFEVRMEALVNKFREWEMSKLRIAHHIRYELNCNWKLILQNYQECYHCPGVHPLLSQWTPVHSAQHDYSKGAVIGGFMDLTRERGSMTMDGSAAGPPVGCVGGEDLQRIYYYSVFPNLLLTPHPDFVMYHHIIPQGPGKIINDCYWLFHPDTIKDSKSQEGIRSAVEFWDLTNRQDWQVCEQMQQGTKSKRFTRGYYSGREDVLLTLDHEVLKALGHTIEDGDD